MRSSALCGTLIWLCPVLCVLTAVLLLLCCVASGLNVGGLELVNRICGCRYLSPPDWRQLAGLLPLPKTPAGVPLSRSSVRANSHPTHHYLKSHFVVRSPPKTRTCCFSASSSSYSVSPLPLLSLISYRSI